MRSYSSFAAILLLAIHPPALDAQPVALDPALRAAADSVVAFGRPDGPLRPWPDLGDSLRLAQRARVDRAAAMLRAIPRASLASADERLLLDNLTEVLDGSIGSRVCRTHLWYAPSAFAGWHITASNWARNVRVGDATARASALAALRALPDAIAAEQAMLQRGLDSGVVSSVPVIRGVIQQLADLTPDDITRSPLAAPAQRDTASDAVGTSAASPSTVATGGPTAGAFAEEYLGILRGAVYPAARAYAGWLARTYVLRARADGALTTLRDGPACHRATMRERTSVDLDPASLMGEARAEIDRIHATLAPMIRRATGSEVSDGIRILKRDARFTFASRDSTLAAYRAMTALAATRIGRVVAGFAPESIVVIPYPEFQERAGVPPSYQRAPDDRSRPAWFLVNLGRPERMAVGNAVAHEAYPGHHLQRIAASQATSIHPVMRTLQVSAFSEGWGIYSEDLGAEMGLYTTPLDSIGHLVHLLDVAVAYYLDAGAHVRGWTREVLIDSMYVLGGRTRAQAGDYADRHAGTPGQLATYYVGYRVIRAARAEAQRRLGARFDVAAFNREVIRHGTITLASLRDVLAQWVEMQEAPRAAREGPPLLPMPDLPDATLGPPSPRQRR